MADRAFARRFGSNLAHLRREAQLSQEELGVRAEMHRTAIGQLERGERVARSDSLVKLAASLGVDPCLFLVGLRWTPATYEPGSFGVLETRPPTEQDPGQGISEASQPTQK